MRWFFFLARIVFLLYGTSKGLISVTLRCDPGQVCDKEWHHYVLNIEFPSVALYVDGNSYDPFLVTEDYPLHPSKIETQLVVGACWQGKL